MSTSRTLTLSGAAVALAVVLVGCSTPAPPTSAPSVSPTVSQAPATPDAATSVDVEEAQLVAVEAMNLYVARAVDADQWWLQLSPYLAAEAAFTVEGTDPQQIPATAITGEPVSVGASGTFVSVLLPTDAGQYRLDMTRRGDDPSTGSWVVFALVPPEGTR